MVLERRDGELLSLRAIRGQDSLGQHAPAISTGALFSVSTPNPASHCPSMPQQKLRVTVKVVFPLFCTGRSVVLEVETRALESESPGGARLLILALPFASRGFWPSALTSPGIPYLPNGMMLSAFTSLQLYFLPPHFNSSETGIILKPAVYWICGNNNHAHLARAVLKEKDLQKPGPCWALSPRKQVSLLSFWGLFSFLLFAPSGLLEARM